MVRFLTSYIKNREICPKGSKKIYMKAEIERYKTIFPGKKPTIIFDFMACISMLIDNENDILCGGRHSEAIKRAEYIFKELKTAGADLVYFLDGPIKPDKFRVWLERTNGKYEKCKEIFKSIRNGTPLENKFCGRILTTYYDTFRMVAAEYGKIFISFENECDTDLAAFAYQIKALAIFSLDTDFLIMPGDFFIWSPSQIYLKDFTTFSWNKKMLRESLNLQQKHMPILSTLSGNDYIPFECLQHVYSMIGMDNFLQHLAKYIRTNFPNGVPLSSEDIETIAKIIHNDDTTKYTLKDIIYLVKISLEEFHNYNKRKIIQIKPDWLNEHIEKTHTTIVYIIYKNIPFSINQSYIDLSKDDVRSFSDLVVPIFKRQMGIILNERRNEKHERVVYLKPSHEEPFQKKIFSPIFPTIEIPPIHILLNDNDELTNVTEDDKLQILSFIVSSTRKKLNIDRLWPILGTIYVIPGLILNYLVKENQITHDEADIMILSIQTAYDRRDNNENSIKPPEMYKERPFWLAFVYTHLIYHFTNALTISGLFKYVTKSYFDGFIFHKMFMKFMEMDYDEKMKLIEPIQKYRLYVNY